MDLITKTFKGIVKSIDEVNYTVTVTVSTDEVDRDNEVVDPKAFIKRIGSYKAHPILLSSHIANKTLQMQIGEAIDIQFIPHGMDVTFKYYANAGNDEATWGWYLVTRGIAAFSIGFLPFAKEDGSQEAGYALKWTDVEMYEISQVLIPSNRGAIQNERKDEEILIIKSFYKEEVEKLMEEKDIEQVVGLAEMLSHLNYVKDWFVHSMVGADTITKVDQAMALIMDCVKEQAKLGKKDFETKSGRTLSAANMAKLNKIHKSIHEATKEFKAFLDDTQTPEELPPEDKPKKELKIDVKSVLEKMKQNLGGK